MTIMQVLLAGGPSIINVDYFLIAGGARPASGYYSTGTGLKVNKGDTYTVTVGGGGPNSGGQSAFGNITATWPTNFANGQSDPPGEGYATGGGGGAAQAGQPYIAAPAPDQNSGGNGGNGVLNGYNGAGQYYYGGGGGGKSSYATGGNGGLGGGGGGGGGQSGTGGTGGGSTEPGSEGQPGSSGAPGNPGGAGGVNSGGGGSFGGGFQGTPSVSGGSGIVIIRYPDNNPLAASTTGSPIVNTTGGFRIYKWTGSGSITF